MTISTLVSTPKVSLNLDSKDLAETYDRVSDRQFNHGNLLIEELELRPGQHVLDIGCGTGRLGAYVAALVGGGGSVRGVDPLPLRVELATRKHPNFRALVGQAEDLSQFGPSSFDAAYANSVFHWVYDKPKALAEAFRVLRPGGRFAVNSADADRPHQSAELVREAVLEEGLDGVASAQGTNFRVNERELRALLENAGFSDVRVTPHTFTDEIADVDDLISWSQSSSFGNFLSELDLAQRLRVRARLSTKLEQLRYGGKIGLRRHLVFASARKP